MTNFEKATVTLTTAQVVFLICFGVFARYEKFKDPGDIRNLTYSNDEPMSLQVYYPMFMDVHLMTLVGFGLLMTFLRRHGFTSLGFNFLLACYVTEWSLLVNGWFGFIKSNRGNVIYLNLLSLLEADFAVSTVLISFGVILGVAGPVQLIVMATVEVVFYNVNLYVGVVQIGALDVGGSMFIHVFGAYFGLAVARVLYRKAQTESSKESSEYYSDIIAITGTLFLWLYGPSFNASRVPGDERQLAVMNTLLSLTACTVVTFAFSASLEKNNKLDMIYIQNATLAGGVAMGACADLISHPFGALLLGSTAALVSTFGFKHVQPFLQRTMKLHDTCGVHNLHGMPGILGAFASAIACAISIPQNEASNFFGTNGSSLWWQQPVHQLAALVATIVISVIGGTITGFLLKLPILDRLDDNELYEDEIFWDCGEEEKEINGV